jgi:hypothetical protein
MGLKPNTPSDHSCFLPSWLRQIQAIELLWQAWQLNFSIIGAASAAGSKANPLVRWRTAQEGASTLAVDGRLALQPQAYYGKTQTTILIGYKVHLTGT